MITDVCMGNPNVRNAAIVGQLLPVACDVN